MHSTSNTHRAGITEKFLMVDPLKGCVEINLHNNSHLLTLQYTLQCMGHIQKCITGIYPDISDSKMDKHTTALNKSSETNVHQKLKRLIDNTHVMKFVNN